MAFQCTIQGKAVVRSVKAGTQGAGDFATLEETEGKYRDQINVALPLGFHLSEGEVVDYVLTGTHRRFQREGRFFETFFADDFRCKRYTVSYVPVPDASAKAPAPSK